jgi:hypothetical protein
MSDEDKTRTDNRALRLTFDVWRLQVVQFVKGQTRFFHLKG